MATVRETTPERERTFSVDLTHEELKYIVGILGLSTVREDEQIMGSGYNGYALYRTLSDALEEGA